MKNYISSKIECLSSQLEEAVIITLEVNNLAETVVLLVGLTHNKLKNIVFRDETNLYSVILSYFKSNKKEDKYLIQIGERRFEVKGTWIDSLISMMLEVLIKGWYQGAHIDYDFACEQRAFELCFAVNSPYDEIKT